MSEVGWKMRTSSDEFARLDALCRQLDIAYSAAYRLAVEWHAARTGLELDSTGSHICRYSPLSPGQVTITIARFFGPEDTHCHECGDWTGAADA